VPVRKEADTTTKSATIDTVAVCCCIVLLQCDAAVCCSALLQCVAVCCSVLQCDVMCRSAKGGKDYYKICFDRHSCIVLLHCVAAVCCSVHLQCVTVCCSVLQCVAACCSAKGGRHYYKI